MDQRGAFAQPVQPHCQGQVVVFKDFITFLVCTAVTVFVCVCCCILQKRRRQQLPVCSNCNHRKILKKPGKLLAIFKRHYSDLQRGIQSPSELAGELYSGNIITPDVRNRGQMTTSTTLERNAILLNAVEQAISSDPQCFRQFMDILDDEPTTKPLCTLLKDTYDEIIQDHSNKSSNMSPYPLSMQPHTTTPIPQQLTIRGPRDYSKTVKVVPDVDKTPENDYHWYTLSVSILDSSSLMPLNCAVVLKGDKLAPGKGTIVCYLTFNVKYKGSQASADPPTVQTHYIERRSEYTANGRATFRMCFYTEASYSISVGVACLQNKEGLECAGYNVDQYTTVIRAVRMVERGAFKHPPLLEFHGPLASKRFRKLMTLYRELHYKGKHDKTQQIRARLLSSDRVELDIRLYISALNVTDSSHDIEQGEELLKKCQTLDCQNGSLLQAYCLMSLATLYYDNGDKEKASEYIHHARSECYGAASSYLTSLVFYCEARNLLRQHKGNVTPCIKGKAMRLFNCAIADSYYAVGWEKYVLCLCHIKMAMFCLSESIGYEFYPSSNYTPSDEDISLAEKHLKAVSEAIPVDELREMSWYAISYHIAQSDLNRLRRDTASAREHVKMAEKVLHDLKTAPKYTNKFGTPISSRLQYLEADLIDKILEEYNYK